MPNSIDDFVSTSQRYQDFVQRRVFIGLGAMFGLILLGWIVRETVALFRDPLPLGVAFVVPATFVAGFAMFVYALWGIERRFVDYPVLICPHCGKSLARHPHIVVASRNCFHCGERVIAGERDTMEELTLAEREPTDGSPDNS